jgi:hypothetical protein
MSRCAAGDAVGRHDPTGGQEPRIVAPRRGRSALNALMAALHDVQSSRVSSDFRRPPPR